MRNWQRGIWLLALAMAWGGGLASPAWALFAVEISPARFELAVDPGKTTRAVIRVRTRERMQQKVEITKGWFGLDDAGVPTFNAPGDKKQSAADWITFSQSSLTVNPNQNRMLRLEIAVPPGTPPGGYRAAVFLAPPVAEAKREAGKATTMITGRLALIIYVTVGGAKPDGEIKAWGWRQILPGKPQNLAFQVTNRGNAHLRLFGLAQVKDSQGEKYEAQVPALPVLQGQTRWIPLEFPEKAPSVGSAVGVEGSMDLGHGEKKFSAQIPGSK